MNTINFLNGVMDVKWSRAKFTSKLKGDFSLLDVIEMRLEVYSYKI